MSLIIYTDGASRGNPGNGGYGAILKWGDKEKEISEGYRRTTNNRMELVAVIKALEAIKVENLEIQIYTDSKYVVDSVELGWVFNWEKKGFAGKLNIDLWQQFLILFRKHKKIKMNWVRGHSNNVMNNRCDILATSAADGGNLKVDEVYEKNNPIKK